MRKLVTVASLAAAMLMIPAAAGAAPPPAVSGTETITSLTSTVVGTADGNTIIAISGAGTITGSFTGTFTAEYTSIVHPSGLVNDVHGTYICTCSFAGRSGSITFGFEGTGSSNGTELNATTIGATGGLAGLHSTLTVDVAGTAVTYSGTAHFAP
jgi:hypothetical protein